MKVSKLFFVGVAMLSIAPCFAKQVGLKGDWKRVHKTITMDLPMDAIFEESSKELFVNFHEDLGEVCISVINNEGKILYSEIFQATENAFSIIPLDNLDIEEGMVFITNDYNNIYGKLIIK